MHRAHASDEPGPAPVPHEAPRPRPGRGPRRLIALLVLALPLGCGYALSSKTNPHIKTIAVPLFQNESLEKGIEETLTGEIIDVLQENRTLTLTKEKNADSVLHGKILEYQRAPYSYDRNETVQEYKITIIISAEYEDRVKRKILWSEPRLLGWSTYSVVGTPGSGASDEPGAQLLAIQKLAEDLKTRTVEGW
jgi:hypothetical protein